MLGPLAFRDHNCEGPWHLSNATHPRALGKVAVLDWQSARSRLESQCPHVPFPWGCLPRLVCWSPLVPCCCWELSCLSPFGPCLPFPLRTLDCCFPPVSLHFSEGNCPWYISAGLVDSAQRGVDRLPRPQQVPMAFPWPSLVSRPVGTPSACL